MKFATKMNLLGKYFVLDDERFLINE